MITGIRNNLKKIRKSNNLSQKELAEKLGMKRESVLYMENKARKISRGVLDKLIVIFNCKDTDIIEYNFE